MATADRRMEEEDTFKILVATDCHLGFQEKDPIRGNDSMVTFEEILSTAKKREVDFILLAGDLFHENKPSRKILHHTMHLFRKYCFGDKPVPFQFLSQQKENFKHCGFPWVNYEDPNYNVGIPVFSIHGNHDDPAGIESLCSLDLLSVSGFVNYYGKFTDLESINISPILLQKGVTKLAMYGLGSMKDERLHRMMRDGKVTMLCPKDKSSEWFNLMSIHQNRVRHGQTNHIPEEFLDDLLDLVIWGHEHECRIEPEWNSRQNFYVSQPGSSVATSLCHAETVPKHIGILEIHKKDFRMIKIPLQTVRPMFVEDVDLQDCKINYDLMMTENVMEYCKEKLDSILKKSENDHTGHDKQPKLPLVRLRVEYTQDDQIFNIHRFGQAYCEQVANPKELIIFHRRRKDKDYKHKDIGADVKNILLTLNREDVETTRVEDVVKSVFENLDESKQLMLLTEEGLTDALQEFVIKEETSAISEFVLYQVNKVQKHLKTQQEFNEDDIEDHIVTFKKENSDVSKHDVTNTSTRSNRKVPEQHTNQDHTSSDDDMDIDDDIQRNRNTTSYAEKKIAPKRGKSKETAKVPRRKKSNFRSIKDSFYSTIEDENGLLSASNDSSDNEVSVIKPKASNSIKSLRKSPPKLGRGGKATLAKKSKPATNARAKGNNIPSSTKPSRSGDISSWCNSSSSKRSKRGHSSSDSDCDDVDSQSSKTSVIKSSMHSTKSRKGLVYFDD